MSRSKARHAVVGLIALAAIALAVVPSCRGGAEPEPADTVAADSTSGALAGSGGASEPSTPVPLGRLALSLDPIPARQGGQVRLSGRGFGPSETVVISAPGAPGRVGRIELYRAQASAAGTLDGVPVALPEQLTSGRHDIEAVGEVSGRTSAGVLWVRSPDPWINLPSAEMTRSEELGMNAGGFDPAESVTVSLEPRPDDTTPEPTRVTTGAVKL